MTVIMWPHILLSRNFAVACAFPFFPYSGGPRARLLLTVCTAQYSLHRSQTADGAHDPHRAARCACGRAVPATCGDSARSDKRGKPRAKRRYTLTQHRADSSHITRAPASILSSLATRVASRVSHLARRRPAGVCDSACVTARV